MTSPLKHNETLGRLVRKGGWAELAEGTPRLIARALAAGDEDTVSALTEFFQGELRVVFEIYEQWFRDTRKCLTENGMGEDELDHEHDAIRRKLALFHVTAASDRNEVWDDIGGQFALVRQAGLPVDQRKKTLENAVNTWRDLHDCEVDQLSGLFHLIMDRHGEPFLRNMYEGWVIGDWFAKRYQRFDVSKIDWETASWLLIYLGFEGHHGHLSGTARDGTIDFLEDDEKVTISFEPCGSGGRSMEGDAESGLPSLSAPPFNWPELTEAYDFTWSESGICAYCAHCCILHENLPIAAFGYPVRVTHPPRAPLMEKGRCSWTIYKDLRNIPDEAYRRVGAIKPPARAPLGSAGRAERDAIIQRVHGDG